jgi:DNA-binding MarR family transcriptional regulator
MFDADLFFDPAWDMLLELYAAHLDQFDLCVGDLCVGSGVPLTTTLRWIRTMEEQGLLHRRDDPTHKRRVLVILSETAARRMDALFESIPATEVLV